MTRSQRLLAAFFTFAGTMHFVRPRAYEAIMPPGVPMHREAVAVSGVAEIVGGLAVISPATRAFARWWLLALLIAVFPANVYMATNAADLAARGVPADRIPKWMLWARLPLQPLMMWWAWRATSAEER
ncbi:MAG: DoxX family protein [Gemmatimonadales bacterium]